jgi:hypothetical protein
MLVNERRPRLVTGLRQTYAAWYNDSSFRSSAAFLPAKRTQCDGSEVCNVYVGSNFLTIFILYLFRLNFGFVERHVFFHIIFVVPFPFHIHFSYCYEKFLCNGTVLGHTIPSL